MAVRGLLRAVFLRAMRFRGIRGRGKQCNTRGGAERHCCRNVVTMLSSRGVVEWYVTGGYAWRYAARLPPAAHAPAGICEGMPVRAPPFSVVVVNIRNVIPPTVRLRFCRYYHQRAARVVAQRAVVEARQARHAANGVSGARNRRRTAACRPGMAARERRRTAREATAFRGSRWRCARCARHSFCGEQPPPAASIAAYATSRRPREVNTSLPARGVRHAAGVVVGCAGVGCARARAAEGSVAAAAIRWNRARCAQRGAVSGTHGSACVPCVREMHGRRKPAAAVRVYSAEAWQWQQW